MPITQPQTTTCIFHERGKCQQQHPTTPPPTWRDHPIRKANNIYVFDRGIPFTESMGG